MKIFLMLLISFGAWGKEGVSNTDLLKIKENNEKIKTLLLQRSSEPLIWDGRQKILTGRTFRGRLLNSLVSTNMESPVLVEAYSDQGLPYGTKFSCSGTTKFKRVHTFCKKLVTDSKELAVSVQVLNTDGSAGLLGIYDDGKDELIAGVLASNMAQGMIAGAQGRMMTGLGEVTNTGLKSQLLEGAFNSAKGVSDILTEEMKTKEPVVMIDAGKEVLIYFMEAADVY